MLTLSQAVVKLRYSSFPMYTHMCVRVHTHTHTFLIKRYPFEKFEANYLLTVWMLTFFFFTLACKSFFIMTYGQKIFFFIADYFQVHLTGLLSISICLFLPFEIKKSLHTCVAMNVSDIIQED